MILFLLIGHYSQVSAVSQSHVANKWLKTGFKFWTYLSTVDLRNHWKERNRIAYFFYSFNS